MSGELTAWREFQLVDATQSGQLSLASIHCPPVVRYGEMNVNANEAWTCHKALLSVLQSIGAAGLDQLT